MPQQTVDYGYGGHQKPNRAASLAPLWRAVRRTAASWAIIAITIAAIWFGRSSADAHTQGIYRAAEFFLAYVVIDPFLIAPLILMSRLKHEAKANYMPLAKEEFPATVADSARYLDAVRALERLGFEPARNAWRTTKHANMFVATFIHPENYDGAALAFAQSAMRDVSLLTIWTRFDDGTSLDTSNYPLGGLFRENPMHPIHRFPQFSDAASLYAAHRELLGRRRSLARKIQLKPEMMIGMLDDATERTFAYQAAQGDLVLGPTGEWYGYTWKGAWRHAALSAWWIKPLRQMQNEWRAARELRELGLLRDERVSGALRPDLDNRPLG